MPLLVPSQSTAPEGAHSLSAPEKLGYSPVAVPPFLPSFWLPGPGLGVNGTSGANSEISIY